jgi:hypothetical protein
MIFIKIISKVKYRKIQWKENKVSINKSLKEKSKVSKKNQDKIIKRCRIMITKRRKTNQMQNKIRKIAKRKK